MPDQLSINSSFSGADAVEIQEVARLKGLSLDDLGRLAILIYVHDVGKEAIETLNKIMDSLGQISHPDDK